MVFEKLRKTLAEQLEVNENNITMDTRIVDDLGADSLDVVELIMALEDEYGISVSDDAISELSTVGQVVDFIENILEKK